MPSDASNLEIPDMKRNHEKARTSRGQHLLSFAIALVALSTSAMAADTSPQQQLLYWSTQAGGPASSERGKTFFRNTHGNDWSCASCHGATPITQGKHVNTGKLLAPLAPAFNGKTFTDKTKVDKWFRRNCKDVLGRECSAMEKADVIAFLISLKP